MSRAKPVANPNGLNAEAAFGPVMIVELPPLPLVPSAAPIWTVVANDRLSGRAILLVVAD